MLLNEIISLRGVLHEIPERSGQEQQTIQTLLNFLNRCTTLELHPRDGWFYALHREPGAERTIAVRGDMDAIENSGGTLFHGCGHDGHSAILAGLGAALEGTICGKNVCLVFQPAEETGDGGARVCEALLRELRPNRILGYHNIPGAPVGTVLLRPGTFACASLGLAIEVEGQQSHAAYPEQGKNPAYLLSEMVLRLPELIAQISEGNRERLLMATVVQLKVGERNFGVSAGTGALALTLRGNRQEDLEALEHSIVELVQEGCASRGMCCRFQRQDVFPDTVTHKEVYAQVEKILRRTGAPTQVLPEPMRWSEDFGWYLHRIPGVYLGFGAGETCCGLHTDGYAFPDSVLEPAINTLKSLVKNL